MKDTEQLERIKENRYEILRPPLEHCRTVDNTLPPNAYSVLPSRIFTDARIHGACIRVMGALCCYVNGRSGTLYPNQSLIARQLGVCQQAVSRQMRLLEKYGYIKKIIRENTLRKKGRQGATWRIIYDPGVLDEDIIANNKPEHVEEQDARETLEVIHQKSKISTFILPDVVNKDKDTLLPDVVKPAPRTTSRGSDKQLENICIKDIREKARQLCSKFAQMLEERWSSRGNWRWDVRQEAIVEEWLSKGIDQKRVIKVLTSSLDYHVKESRRPPYSLAFYNDAFIKKEKTVEDLIKRVVNKTRFNANVSKSKGTNRDDNRR